MVKTGGAKRKARTHFEQIPLKVIEKLLGREAGSIAKAAIKPKGAGRPGSTATRSSTS